MPKLLAAAAKSIAPPARLTPSEWAESKFFLSAESSSEPGRINFDRAPYQREMLDAIADPAIEEVVIMSSSQVGKALDVETPIATPEGWKKMGEMSVGDIVFDELGNPCKVTAISPVQYDRDCYAVTFSDNSVIIADADHLWTVEEYKWAKIIGTPTLTTREMSANFKTKHGNRYAIPVAKPIVTQEKDLLIDPYLLGVWLGDGHSGGARISCHKDDLPFYQKSFAEKGHRIEIHYEKRNENVVRMDIDPRKGRTTCARGHQFNEKGKCKICMNFWEKRSRFKKQKKDFDIVQPDPVTFGRKLVAIGVASAVDKTKQKSIPQSYLRGSYQQRLDLLCGLMDTDGYVNPKNGRCEFSTTSEAIALGVQDLLAGLGIKFTMKEKIPQTIYKGKRVFGKKSYRFSFLVYSEKPIFKLPRKLQCLQGRDGKRTTETEKRRIVDISSVESRPVKCIAVDSPSHLYLAGRTMIPTHNTTIELAMTGFLIDLQPCPIMWMAPTLEMAESTSKDRIAPMLRDSPCFADKVKPPTAKNSGNTLLSKKFGGGQLVLVGANSPASLASRPIRAILGDELDRFPESAGTEGDPVNLARKRSATFWNKLHIWVSTPTIKDKSRIEKLWLLSDKRHYLVACPHCDHRQALVWEGLQYENKGKIDLSRSDVGEVVYRCAGCGADIEEHQKTAMLAAGQWEASGRQGKIAGFHLNELYSPWKSWQDVARDFEAAQGDPLRMQVFWNTSLGLPFEHDGATKFDWENLQYRADASDYSMGQLPAGVLLLTSGIDVQGDRLECSVFGWGESEQAWLIRHDVLFGDPLDDGVWEDLDHLLKYDFSHPLGGTLRVRKAAIDSGYLAQEVYRRSRGRKDWMVIKGVAGDRKMVGPGTWQEINWQNKPIKRGIKLHALGVDLLKQTMLGRCRIAAPGPKYLNLPVNVPAKYCQELAGSEVMVKKKVNSSWKYVWETVPGVRNEPLDCAVYAYAAAIFLGLPRFNANHWDKIRQSLNVQESTAPIAETPQPEAPAPKPEPPPRRKPVRRINNYLNGFGRGF